MRALLRLARIALANWGNLVWWALLRLHFLDPEGTPVRRLCRMLEQLGTRFVELSLSLELETPCAAV